MTSTTQWEYRLVTSTDGLYVTVEDSPDKDGVTNVPLDDYMTRIGALGWELVAVYSFTLGYNFVFKRPFPVSPVN